VQEVEAGLDLVDGGFSGGHRFAHGLEDELRLRRRLGGRRGESLLNPNKPTPGLTEIGGGSRSSPKFPTAGRNFTAQDLANWEPSDNPNPVDRCRI
jgi:hypothetical protein